MKKLIWLIATLLASACLALAVMTVRTSRSNVQKQRELAEAQTQIAQIRDAVQNEVRSLQGTEQLSQNVLKDLGNSALTNAAIRAMLAKNGYTLSSNAPPANASAVPVVSTTAVPATKPANEVVSQPVSVPVEPAKDAKKEDKP
jgi:hypothetical protein